MSSTPKAILYYGFPIECPDEETHGKDYHDMNSEWSNTFGPQQPSDESNYSTPEWDQWRENNRDFEKSTRNIQIEWSGGDECEAYYMHAEGLEQTVEWNEQKPLADIDLGVKADADSSLKEFCEMFGIEFKKPGWHLGVKYF